MEAIAQRMFLALVGIQMFAEQQANDICAIVQEGGTMTAQDKLDLDRWSAVQGAIDDYLRHKSTV